MSGVNYIFAGRKPFVFNMQKINITQFKNIECELKGQDWERPVIEIDVYSTKNNKCYKGWALLDTGSPDSFISKGIKEGLELEKVSDKKYILEFDEDKYHSGEFEAVVILHNAHIAEPIKLKFGVFNPVDDYIHMVIGTDILSNFEFVYNHPKKKFSLKYIV